MKMEKEMTPNEKRPQQDCGGMFTQVQASVEILSPVPVSGKCSEKDYERLFIRDPEVKAREGKMAYVIRVSTIPKSRKSSAWVTIPTVRISTVRHSVCIIPVS